MADAIVKQVLGSMHSIATSVSDTSATVGLLGKTHRSHRQIVTVIDEIARKTDLLALNAAIEAAAQEIRAVASPSSPGRFAVSPSPPRKPPVRSPP